MIKEFLPYETVRNDALKIAHKIFQDGFIPDVIYASLRGGAYMANVISEYFKILPHQEILVFTFAQTEFLSSPEKHERGIFLIKLHKTPNVTKCKYEF